MARNPAERRHHDARIKARVRALLPIVWHAEATPKRTGKAAAVHMRPCSCEGCQRHNRKPEGRATRIDTTED